MGCCASNTAGGGSKASRMARWRSTGIIRLRDSKLKTFPDEVIVMERAVRTLDLTHNKISDVPAEVSKLINMQRLLIADNLIERLPGNLGKLQSLKVLMLDGNRISCLPDELGQLIRLEQLSISRNMLIYLPDTIGSLRNLVLLNVSNNRLKSLPESVGSCASLEEIQANDNVIEELPASLCNLIQLKSLCLDNNQVKQIQCLKPSKEGAEDIYVWLPLESGVYSTKSGYNSKTQLNAHTHLQQRTSNPPPNLEFDWLKDVWSIKTAPKLKLFLWSIIQGALPLGSELQRRGMINAAACPRCKKEESATHIFFQCPFAKEVWRHIPLNSSVHLADAETFESYMGQFRSALCLPPTGIRSPVLPWICWSLWTARNKLIFDDKTAQPLEIATKGLAAALEWDLAQSTDQLKRNQVFPQAPSRRQIPGIQSYPSCFVDAAWDASSNRAGIAWHFTNDLGTNSPPGSQIIDNVASPLMAESLALRQGIKEALSLGKKSVSFHSDCATLIRAISTQSQIKEIYGVLQDIKHLSANFDRIQFLHISRSQNREADYLAKVALKAHPFPSCFVMG